MPDKVKLIFNPHADKGNAWRLASTLQSLIERQGGASWAATEYPGHATELTLNAANEGLDSKERIEDLVIQICYRVADLGYLLKLENGELADYTDWLRREKDVDYSGIGLPNL